MFNINGKFSLNNLETIKPIKPTLVPGIYNAIMVEPRIHKAYGAVLNCFLTKLSIEWNIILGVGNKNYGWVQELIQSAPFNEHKSRIKIVHMDVDNLNAQTYTNIFIDANFYSYIPTEVFLVFQCDTWICATNPSEINQFLQYDYVGAPWPHHNNMVGNGGLSLRRKSAMLRIIREFPFKPHSDLTGYETPEDVYFAEGCLALRLNVPNWVMADKFSNENRICEHSWGVHQPWIGGIHGIVQRIQHTPDLLDLLVLNDIVRVEQHNEHT